MTVGEGRGERLLRDVSCYKAMWYCTASYREYPLTQFWEPAFSPGNICSSSDLSDALPCRTVWAARSSLARWWSLESTTCRVGPTRAHSTFCTSNPVKGDHDPNNGDIVSSSLGIFESTTLPGGLLCSAVCRKQLGVKGTLLFGGCCSTFLNVETHFSCFWSEGGAGMPVSLSSVSFILLLWKYVERTSIKRRRF